VKTNAELFCESVKSMKLILVRHGQTISNAEKRYQGRIDAPLSEKGERQIKAVAEELKSEKIDAIYSSTIGRALKTAKEIAKFHKVLIEEKKELGEVSYGKFEGKTIAEVKAAFPGEYEKRRQNTYYHRPPGGETLVELEERVAPLVKKIISDFSGKTVVVVAHNNVNKIIIKHFLGYLPETVSEYFQPNDCIYFIQWKQGRAVLTHKFPGKKEKNGFVKLE